MEKFELGGMSFAALSVAAGMLGYEWARTKAKRPLFSGREIVTIYWMTYLALFVLALTAGTAAIVR